MKFQKARPQQARSTFDRNEGSESQSNNFRSDNPSRGRVSRGGNRGGRVNEERQEDRREDRKEERKTGQKKNNENSVYVGNLCWNTSELKLG